jgi:predicted RNA binding protein YcfA (HicA-like mRNA interferase family)
MAKLPVVSGEQALRAFERLGYMRVSQSGSHVRLKAEGKTSLTVPLHRELKRGLLRSLIRDAGISVEVFGEHL